MVNLRPFAGVGCLTNVLYVSEASPKKQHLRGMLCSKALVSNGHRVAGSTRLFHLGHEYAPPARYIGPHTRFGLALLSAAIQLSSITFLYLNADKLRPPPPRKLGDEAVAELKRRAPLFENGTMSLKKF